MARYRFYCTNGLQCVLDTIGCEIRRPARLPETARAAADHVMATLALQTDWQDWQVSVHDLSGRRVFVQSSLSQKECVTHAA